MRVWMKRRGGEDWVVRIVNVRRGVASRSGGTGRGGRRVRRDFEVTNEKKKEPSPS